jgi:hypothetical protein
MYVYIVTSEWKLLRGMVEENSGDKCFPFHAMKAFEE